MDKTSTYRVVWEIDIEAVSALLAAQQALRIQRDPQSSATVFDVTGPDGHTKTVDLRPISSTKMNDSIRKTCFEELGYVCDGPGLWRVVDLSDGRQARVGPQYRTKVELLADLERYARFFGCKEE